MRVLPKSETFSHEVHKNVLYYIPHENRSFVCIQMETLNFFPLSFTGEKQKKIAAFYDLQSGSRENSYCIQNTKNHKKKTNTYTWRY